MLLALLALGLQQQSHLPSPPCLETLDAFEEPEPSQDKRKAQDCSAPRAANTQADIWNTPPEALLKGIESKHWENFYALSAAYLKRGKPEEASFWFYVGQMRGRAFVRCLKPEPSGSPALLASLNSVLGQPINEYLAGSIKRTVSVIDRAIQWNAEHPDPLLPQEKCADALAAVVKDKMDQRTYFLEHAPEIRAARAENGLPNDPE